ncbi:unnamed protein product [Psylliodes chrysocephalus]|uniref:Cytosolic fatty-acid binding proteins domain-containing protein n=1 Tax=Psylliodes chrysocephalus TaxID=3402493 RepID=A0A9P0CDS8_9CUCU|nr:unnamed protein product [Psylliodes chrysocephala]
MVDVCLGKKYKLESSENFDEFMKALGVGFLTRIAGAAVTPIVDLKKENEYYILSSISTFKHFILKFKPGVQFDEETPDGRQVKATISIVGNTLHEVQIDANGLETIIDRTFTPDEVKMVMNVDDVSATRLYKVTTE